MAAPNKLSLFNTLAVLALALGLPCIGTVSCIGMPLWAAWRGDSEDVSGVTAVEPDNAAYLVVSGYSEHSWQDSTTKRTRSDAYPRLTTYRATDGEQVARRQFAPTLFRFSYVDTQVRTLVATGGKVWTTASDKEQPLFAVHPVTLVDEVDFAGLNTRIPALSAGIYQEPGGAPPVGFADGALLMRLNSGPVLALDPATLATRDGTLDALEDAQRGGTPRGDSRLDAAVRSRPDQLEPRVVPVFNLDGTPDPSAGFVVTQTSLDREQAALRVSR